MHAVVLSDSREEAIACSWMVCRTCRDAHLEGWLGQLRPSRMAAVKDQVRHNLPGGCPARQVESRALRERIEERHNEHRTN